MGCNARGEWPTRFNGGLFTFDPILVSHNNGDVYTPDWRAWSGGTFTAQNQRMVHWGLLKSGDFDIMTGTLVDDKPASFSIANHSSICSTV